MSEHRYILEPYKGMQSRYACPQCANTKSFSLYIDAENNEAISPKVGRCERVDKCAYHYKPKQYFQDNGIIPQQSKLIPMPIEPPKPISYINAAVMQKSLRHNNNFIKYLNTLFDTDTIYKVTAAYNIGTSKHWSGAVVFWQVDTESKVRTGKIMLYNEVTGKRVKEPHNHITWAHTALKLKEFELKQCFYGLHLIKGNTKPIAIVESEKTAIIASGYLPQFVWLACGSLQNINKEKCEPLAGRNVVLYPDLNGFEKWQTKAKELGYAISDLLEQKASPEDKANGLDIADFLIKLNAKEFNQSISIIKPEVLTLHKRYTEAEQSGLLTQHPQRNDIGKLWQGILANYHSKELPYFTEKLRAINLN